MFSNSNEYVEGAVREELRWEPSLRSDDIAVSVRGGTVALTGHVESYYDRWKAERVASRVPGVKAVANELEVRLPSRSHRADPELARTVLNALSSNIWLPAHRIDVEVLNGWVTLEGEVDWYYQREEAERAIRRITGVRGLSDRIEVRVQPAPSDLAVEIREALERGARFDAARIRVEVAGGRVILDGTVRSYLDKVDAERAARNAPGVAEIENRIVVDPGVLAEV